MYLRSIRIENFRGIREGFVTFEESTVLIGENDCGRTSVIEVLVLLLGSSQEGFEKCLRPVHFHRPDLGTADTIRVNLHIAESMPGQWLLPPRLKKAFPSSGGRVREFDFEFLATLNPETREINHRILVTSTPETGSVVDGSGEALRWLRELIPVLWLRSGLFGNSLQRGAPESSVAIGRQDPDLSALAEHYRNILSGEALDLFSELDAGAEAAQRVLDRHKTVFESAAPLMGAMASDILNRRQVAAATGIPTNTSSYKIGALLLLGAVLELVQRKMSSFGRPILVIENPETNLHPMTVAAAWKIIERLTWQKLIVTNSGTFLARCPLGSIRRLTRSHGRMKEWSVKPRLLSRDVLRRVSYHLRSRRASAMFARCWLLVEGETEYWILPEVARICGFDFGAEGVECVEFAQCGLVPLTKLADHLGIQWHVLVDGDEAGERYAQAIAGSQRRSQRSAQVTCIQERDIEHCFWGNGFADTIQRLAYPAGSTGLLRGSGSNAIRRAIEKSSKPLLALKLIEAVAERGVRSVPPVIRQVIESSVESARRASIP